MSAREAAARRSGLGGGMDQLERLLRHRIGDASVDLPTMADRRASLAESLNALGLFSALIAVLTAGSVIGQGYAYSDVVVLLGVQLGMALFIWRMRWTRVAEAWLLAVVGTQVVFAGSLISLTGGAQSPYFALYAPVVALAGWHLRAGATALAVTFVAVVEIWRVTVVDLTASVDNLSVGLPVLALIALLANLSSRRLSASTVLNRRDQVRTAATQRALQSLGERAPDQPLDVAAVLGDVFGASATMAAFEGDPDTRGCLYPGERHGHMAVVVGEAGAVFGRIRLCRSEAFSASERRLASILAHAMGQQMQRRLLFEEVRRESRRDHLTGLLDRSAFDRDLGRAVEAARGDSASLSLCLVKVDGYTEIAERWGRGRAETIIQRLAAVLFSQAGSTDRVYRFAADTFAVLAPDVPGHGATERGALLRRMATRALANAAGGSGGSPHVSIGVAHCQADGCDPASLVASALAALEVQPAQGA